jgi:hypothetical protein
MKTLLFTLLLLTTLHAHNGLCKQTHELQDAEWIESETEELFKLSNYDMRSKVTLDNLEFTYEKSNSEYDEYDFKNLLGLGIFHHDPLAFILMSDEKSVILRCSFI